jgi:hypothetical protein
MSTIKVTNIDPPSAGGAVNVNGVAMPNAGPLSNRNLIINGAMQVAQRATQVTGVTTQGYRTCDRFELNISALGTWTVDQDTNAPNGFSNSFKVTCTTADASPASGDYLLLQHFIEAQNLQLLGFGSSDAKTTTLSFWVKSNKTGNASIAIRQPDNSNKQVTYQYSISTADTWEYKTIAIPADTSGVINNDNGQGLRIEWWLNSGSDYTGGSHRSTWTAADNTDRNVSNLGVGGATSDYFQITGVQLEVGSQATPFEHRSYGDELARCQRYYWMIQNENSKPVCQGTLYNTNNFYGIVHFPVTMRAAPTLDVSNGTGYFEIFSNASADEFNTMISGNPTKKSIELRAESTQGVGGRTAGHAAWIRTNNASAYIAVTAEL